MPTIMAALHQGEKDMDPSLKGLEPELLWMHFDELRKIPRCSKHEERARQYIKDVAKRLGLASEEDKAGNVLVRKAATRGHEGAPTVVLQGHLDMVCEKNADVAHDFAKDPIQLELRGEDLHARGTTLGADDGIGVAVALAVLESTDLAHGPIEALFTVDEETGLTGAYQLAPGWLKGRIMLNLDSEDMNVVTIGCAGGGGTKVELPVTRAPVPAGMVRAMVAVKGLRGGHSGVDIHEYRANAVKLLVRLLWAVAREHTVLLCDIAGGDKHNAIPREASAEVAVDPKALAALKALAVQHQAVDLEEFGGRDPGIRHAVEERGAATGDAMDAQSSRRALHLLQAMPHGVEKFSHAMPELVETSTNLASVDVEGDSLWVMMSTRSSIMGALEALRGRIEAVAVLAGARVEQEDAYPGWNPDPTSPLLAVTKAVHKQLFGAEPKVEAIHAGLETGIVGERYPGMQMISVGPTLKNPHSPDEYVNVRTVEECWRWVAALLRTLAEKGLGA
jgi:dipeptidase D